MRIIVLHASTDRRAAFAGLALGQISRLRGNAGKRQQEASKQVVGRMPACLLALPALPALPFPELLRTHCMRHVGDRVQKAGIGGRHEAMRMRRPRGSRPGRPADRQSASLQRSVCRSLDNQSQILRVCLRARPRRRPWDCHRTHVMRLFLASLSLRSSCSFYRHASRVWMEERKRGKNPLTFSRSPSSQRLARRSERRSVGGGRD